MNSIFALTLLHDHHLSGSSRLPSVSYDTVHFTKAIQSFNKALSQARSQTLQQHDDDLVSSTPISPHHQAALWSTGAMIGTIVFCNIDATTPHQAWPLRPPSPSDLNWLKMDAGKKSIFLLTKGLQTDPTYKPLFEIHTNSLLPPITSPPSFDRLPPELLDYFNVFTSPSDNDRLYHPSIRSLARVYATSCFFITTILTFWTWCADMTPQFRLLLEQKEPRALLMLAFWWAEIYQTMVWWFVRRARLEGMAICLFLERYCWEDEELMGLVGDLKKVFETELFQSG